ncbi:probable glucan endo-1,3-beta-glucosidase BG4 [Rhodamnia argentea]|uniref:glucan endo-1,3-beta-D-glucosidase n=1 Tax=Rhodamnia argentea TaxID=178133 RepID=A0A8B8N0I8_9MYRT|nr:probable glucan endo-1,3-beta-glucosidase BG4 [Rhodamnia argentea]
MALLNIILMLLTFAFLHHEITITEARLDLGVCYGMMGDNLPSPEEVVRLYRSYNIGKMRLLDTNPNALAALRDSGIEVTVGTRNQDLESIASSGSKDVVRHQRATSVVNEYGYSGMWITTVVPNTTLVSFNPPSSATFSDAACADMVGIINFLSSNGSPLMIKAYPYFAFDIYPVNVSLDYVLATATDPVVQDGSLSYSNMLDAIVDGFYWAMEKEGVTGVDVVVSETGWPSQGHSYFTDPELAQTYNKNLVKRFLAKTGMPKRPDRSLGGFIYSMFDENEKPARVDKYFGLFYPSGKPVYRVFD